MANPHPAPGRNHTRGRPHLIGNTFSKGRPKPKGSGRPKKFSEPVSLTIKVERSDAAEWKAIAAACNITLGEYIRDCVNIEVNRRGQDEA